MSVNQRMHRRWAFALCLLLGALGAGCATTSGTTSSEEDKSGEHAPRLVARPMPTPSDANLIPPPFSQEQIRGFMTKGRSFKFLVEFPPQGLRRHRLIEFVAVDATTATLRSTLLSPEGKKIGSPTEAIYSWGDLIKQVSFPKNAVITEGSTTTPAGT